MRSATRPFAQWNRIFAHLQLSKTLEKHENKKQFELNVYFFVFSQKFIPILINQSTIHLELYQLSLNMFMFTKTCSCSLKQTFAECKIFLEGTVIGAQENKQHWNRRSGGVCLEIQPKYATVQNTTLLFKQPSQA